MIIPCSFILSRAVGLIRKEELQQFGTLLRYCQARALEAMRQGKRQFSISGTGRRDHIAMVDSMVYVVVVLMEEGRKEEGLWWRNTGDR